MRNLEVTNMLRKTGAKECTCCKKLHRNDNELSFVGKDMIALYVNCTCGSTLLLTDLNQEQIEQRLAAMVSQAMQA